MKKIKDNDFELKSLPIEAQDKDIKKDDFVLVDNKNRTHEQRLQTKPTTFFKDSLKRFSKNKSSVVAGVILGLLLLLSIFIPMIDTSDVSVAHPDETYLEPKLFNAGVGFWDGTKRYNNIIVDTSLDPNGNDKENNWWPNPETFVENAVSKKTFLENQYTSELSKYGKEGYVVIGNSYDVNESIEACKFTSTQLTENFDMSANAYVEVFDTYNLEKIGLLEGEQNASLPENSVIGVCSLNFEYDDPADTSSGGEHRRKNIELIESKEIHNIGSKVSSMKEDRINITEIIKGKTTDTVFAKPALSIHVKNLKNGHKTFSLVNSFVVSTDSTNEVFKEQFEQASFTDATKCVLESIGSVAEINYKYWSSTDYRSIHMSKVCFCSFTYDTYEAKFGNRVEENFSDTILKNYAKQKWIKWNCKPIFVDGKPTVNKDTFVCQILDPVRSPLAVEIKPEDCRFSNDGTQVYCRAVITQYKKLGYTSMPRYIFGTDKSGKDMLKYVFEGLRTSLLLGIATTAVCCIIGLIWGAISGYFGGTTDLVMERFTDILSGVPWIVVMTLVIIHMGSTFFTFALALCLTGWIGTAATTRTQFYRFRGREYVLASRTLGASDARLIAKHILPNAMGTIITAEVLMVPSVIFSEATISYLGLGLKGLSSLGVILSDNQAELMTSPYLLLFPSIIIALLMISFNLFGNGLRDAVNPSLKGEDE